MCGRYTLRTPLNVLAEQFLFDIGEAQAVPRYNIPPTTEVLAVRHPRELAKFRWGLIPSWAKDAKIAYSTINARADTVATKPAFRSAFKKRRCVVLADGYFDLGWSRTTAQAACQSRTLCRPHAHASLGVAPNVDGSNQVASS